MELRSGMVAVVTGGGSGIGRGMCRSFAAEGLKVAVADLDEGAAKAVADELSGKGVKAIAVRTDVADLASVEALGAAVDAELGGVDVLCNNAGVFIGGRTRDVTPDDWRWVMSVNLDGVYNGTHVFTPRLLARGAGHIVNTASIGGFLTAGEAAVYSATKFAVVAWSEALRGDLAGSGVGVSALCPGPIRSSLADCDTHRPAELSGVGNRSDVLWDMIKDGLEPDEVGPIVLRGIRENAAWIFTHPEWKGAFEERFGAVLAAMK